MRPTAAARPVPPRTRRTGRPRVLDGETALVSGRVPVECMRGLRRLGEGSVSEGMRRLWLLYTEVQRRGLDVQELLSHPAPHAPDDEW